MRLPRLPSEHRQFAFSFLKRRERHQCLPISVGFSFERDPTRYRWDNRQRGMFALFQYTLSGEGRFRDERTGETTAMTPGKAFLVTLPSDTSYWLPSGKTWEFVYICFLGDLALHHTRCLVETYGAVLELPPTTPALDAWTDLYVATASGRSPDEYAASALLYRMLMELYRVLDIPSETIPEPIRRAKELLETGYGDPSLGIETVAATVGYSKFHFSRLFQKHFGASPYAYLTQYRLRKAVELIVESDEPLKRISRRVGFRDYPNFCHAFHRHWAFTPASVRKNSMRVSGIQKRFGKNKTREERPVGEEDLRGACW